MHRYAVSSALIGILTLVSTPVVAQSTADDMKMITAVSERELASLLAGDTQAALAVFSDDCLVMPPNEPAVAGKVELQSWFAGLHEQFTVSGEYTSSEVSVFGDIAIQRYTANLGLTPKDGGTGVVEAMKGIHVLRRQADGAWLITYDVWNANGPAPE